MKTLKNLFTSNPAKAIWLSIAIFFIVWVLAGVFMDYMVPKATADEAFTFSVETQQAQRVFDSTLTAKEQIEQAYCDAWVNLALMKALDYNNAGDDLNSRAMSEKAADLAYGNCGFISPR